MKDELIYKELIPQMEAVLKGEQNLISILSTVCAMLRTAFSKVYWVGFYLEDHGVLKVGPYQGTMGCLTIEFERGVCGRAYRMRTAQIVDDVHSDPEHIACDAASLSEIVIPLVRPDGTVYGVLDVDSDRLSAFNGVDQQYLQQIVKRFIEPAL
jgi:GAF domain-containing protein